jgi:hypothetical protein
MLTKIGTTFPSNWTYGPEEIEIFEKTAQQIQSKFPDKRNLLINTTWFGPQFDAMGTNNEWQKIEKLFKDNARFDNLFLLSVIDPLYLMDKHTSEMCVRFGIKNVFKIGMFDGSQYEWNFHAIVGDHLMPKYNDDDVILKKYDKDFLCYQRKPRAWRVDFTNLVRQHNLLGNGVITLGAKTENDHDWSEGRTWEPITLDESHEPYKNDGQNEKKKYGGIPNDLVTVGSLDIWNKCFLYISSETEFDHWKPVFVNERIWKPMIGLRPFIIQGNPKTYSWLKKNGFKTFNHYWPHIDLEHSLDVLNDHLKILTFLRDKSKNEKFEMYKDMLPDLVYNKERFYEFSKEQRRKMENLFD